MLHMLPITGDTEPPLAVTLRKFFTTLCNDATVSLRRLSGTEIEIVPQDSQPFYILCWIKYRFLKIYT